MIDGHCGVTQAEEGLIHHGGGLLPGPSGSILPLLQPTRCSSSSLLHQQWKQSRARHRWRSRGGIGRDRQGETVPSLGNV